MTRNDNRLVGFGTELMFNTVINHFNWKICSLPSKKDLLETMQAINPRRLVRALEGAFRGQRLSVEDITAREVMDYVYGVDFIITIESFDGDKNVAIDVTCNIGEVEEKVNKLMSLKPAIRTGLKADHALVVCWVEEQPFGQMSEDEKRDKVWAKVSDKLDWMVEENKWVSSVII